MAMNVPTWSNKGVSPSDERKQEGYSAGQCLPANHLNWFLNQIFTNLEDAKGQLASLTTQSSGNNTYINSIKATVDKLVTNPPTRTICGHFSGTGGTQTINIGATPNAVLVMDIAGTDIEGDLCTSSKPSSDYDGEVRMKVVTNGFSVSSIGCSVAGHIYTYVAFIGY